MAHLPRGRDGAGWMITDIDSDVVILENPGGDAEKIHLRLSTVQKDLVKNVDAINNSDELTDNQKKWAGFWYGYFYGFLRH